MDKTTGRFADYTAALTYADLTPEALHAVKRCLVDSVGCAFGGFNAEPVKALRALAARVTAASPASLFGTRIRSSPEWATLVNATMVRYLDFSDDYFGGDGMQAGPHPSDNIAAVWAAAESSGADGKSLLLGIALAYEACGQLVDNVLLNPRFDYTVMHAVATALGAGRVMGLSRDQLANAVGLAVVPNISLWQNRTGHLSNWKGCAGPNGSRAGLLAAMLAGEGITGPAESFEGPAGFMKVLQCPFELGDFGGGKTPFKVELTYFKYMPVMYSIQTPIWIAFELRQKVKIEDIESIVVYIDAQNLGRGSYSPERWNPTTRETADHSAPFLIGAALVDGEITPNTPEKFRDPAILSLIKKISAREDPHYTAEFPRTFHCRFEVKMRSGQPLSLHYANPKGHPANPMTDREIEAKFFKQAEPLIGNEKSRLLLGQIWNLENLKDVSTPFASMVVPNR
ncbi:MAG: MmgE/PrpD family protein [Dehalococcoidales bacterium]|nr:MmgE/PrpD family protein [Dehalococcoidales bacterium]